MQGPISISSSKAAKPPKFRRKKLSSLQENILEVLALSKPLYGLELIGLVGAQSGSFYPSAANLEARGLVTSRLEEGDPYQLERALRRYYEITPKGLQHLKQRAKRYA